MSPSDLNRSVHMGPRQPPIDAIQINLIGQYYTAILAGHFLNKHFAKSDQLTDRSVVIVGSLTSYRANIWGPDYSAAKMGARGLFKSIRAPYKSKGIRVNFVAPQYIRTPMTEPYAKNIAKSGYRFTEIDVAMCAFLRILSDRTIAGKMLVVFSF